MYWIKHIYFRDVQKVELVRKKGQYYFNGLLLSNNWRVYLHDPTPRPKKPRRPKGLNLYDGRAEYYPPEYDDMGGGAPGLQIDAFIYDAKNARKLAKWLVEAAKYLEHKEKKC